MSNPATPVWKRPEILLILMSVALPLSFSTWQALLNNFTIERAAFTGVEIGILQSLREIPGFLAFGVVFLLLVLREQPLAFISLLLLGLGTALTGFFPSEYGLYITTIIMSIGFHYFETLRQSLALQWLDKDQAPVAMGRMVSAGSFAGLIAFGLIWLGIDVLAVDMVWVYLIGGGLTIGITVWCWAAFPTFKGKADQHKHLVLRKRYWLYYAITFLWGARRQIFVVFAGFLMVEKFGFDAAAMSLMFLATSAMTMWFSPKVGRMIKKLGERKILIIEYTGLIAVFLAYAFVDNAWIAVGLYLLDHLFFAMSFASKTYFQKIADPQDIASTSGVSFTINHIAAVVIPVVFGHIWVSDHSLVFLAGAAMAGASLVLAFLIPERPEAGRETVLAALRQPRPAE
ncbi:MFS transporter [Magnetovibrio sp. PR-2]|uniref:MFS transporter n=1 Tax=Magnetovibrio sp. PR-2 TaxID=3120356 RepID=UPI002FCE3B43